jgi:hypothetical protein
MHKRTRYAHIDTCSTYAPTTQVYKLPANRLYATYFGGDAKQGLPVDEEAKAIWLRFLPEERVGGFRWLFWGAGWRWKGGSWVEVEVAFVAAARHAVCTKHPRNR